MERPSNSEDRYIKIGNLNLHYLEWGSEGAAPIVLLHGLCGYARYWEIFARSMLDKYRLIAVNQRGHGDSDRADSYEHQDFIFDLDGFIEGLGLDKFILIGHSMGGLNAIIYAARHPDLVSGLIVVDIAPEIMAEGLARMAVERINEKDEFMSEKEAFSYIKNLDTLQSDDFIRHQIKYDLKRKGSSLAFKYDKKLRDIELISPVWLWEYVNQIICPTLLIRGMESDLLSGDTAQSVVDKLAFGSLVEINGAGHCVPSNNPEAFKKAVCNFLDNVGYGRS
ncbi:MAG: alpha/beta hydrolase [Dehalococcoidia bacterium]|nr:alpha/beta hydrolase [Dehalococcoidia bacterium]